MTLPAGLYVVATPIGNREDISTRAIQTLEQVNCIAAEDTRHSRILLDFYGIKTPFIALHEHNERESAQGILARIQAGEAIALISDAGTPLLSDPGYFLVRQVQEAGLLVIPIPGACAPIAALSAAGLPTDRFCFEGFLPAKSSSRLKFLQQLVKETRTLIFFESPHRIMESLRALCEVFGQDREAAIARELTKKFETIRRDTLGALLEWLITDENQQRGEFVILVHGAILSPQEDEQDVRAREIIEILSKELPLAQTVKLTAAITGLKKNQVYDLALQSKK